MEPEILPEGSSVPVNQTSEWFNKYFLTLLYIFGSSSRQAEASPLAATLGADAELCSWVRAH